jgi:hypothetical protein
MHGRDQKCVNLQNLSRKTRKEKHFGDQGIYGRLICNILNKYCDV